ncbi:hypothetical protein T03_2851 [Trichinella britovi]|uniref:Uncharacterized protein n=2 Tax=Trichinella TaxID=6333 RepID=A0A0V1CUV6_TRIBR|nr:hypothetical protein T05_11741 [Trichinella murrelli]KRX66875.1 hypothetical protein T09_3133 [Trichinella sp. T9]KRY53072.1 hypothetical protein T03_2851 [Trichinella britovi]KRZ91433.1 hypothetical protein T08_6591 [Trichinella sp. T8]
MVVILSSRFAYTSVFKRAAYVQFGFLLMKRDYSINRKLISYPADGKAERRQRPLLMNQCRLYKRTGAN